MVKYILRKLSSICNILYPYHGKCLRCHRSWALCLGHSTIYSAHIGIFALCEECWAELSIEERIPYYKKCWNGWRIWYKDLLAADNAHPQSEWAMIEAAVRAGR